MHHTAVSGTGAEPGRGGNSRGNRKRGRGRGRGKQVVESSSSTEVQQSAKGRLRKEAPPAEPCSSIASTANATTPGGGPQHPTPTRPGSAPEEIHPQPVGEPENHEDTASFQSFKGPDRQKTASGDSVTIAKSSAAVTDSTGSTSKSSRPPVQVFGALSKNTTGPAAGEGPGRVHSVDEPEYSGHHNNCDGNTVNASPPTRSAKRRNRRKGKAAVKCDDNLSDATVQPNGPNVGHVAPATTSNLEAPEMATIVSSQSTGLNGIGAHAPPMVDTAVGKDIVPPVVAEIIVPLGSALANVNNIPGTGAGRSKRAKRGRGRKNKAEAAASCDDAKTSVHAVGTSGEVNINKCEQHAVPQGSEQGSAPRSQYQHFVPCLVLRAFSTAESRALGGRRGAQVNVYSMKDACITPQPVARCYGYHNMYQDISAADEMHVEKALAVLEGRAAKAIDKVKRAQAKDASSVTLTRTERNNIRKFLFVMLYRRPLFWKKYSFTAENYQLVDRDRVLQFMRKRGFTRPIQVWLHNLKTILDTPIDPKDEWENSILETCFIDDGKWFIQHMNDFFTTFVQPENPENEFIVTDTSFGIHEGPTDTPLVEGGTPEAGNNLEYSFETLQQACGSQVAPAYYTVFHTMAPFSPKLLLVLRSLMLQNEDTKRMLRQAADTSPSPGSDQWKCRSIFDKLHLDIPRANYISPGSHTDGDTFGFTIHKISDQDVWRFNSIFLEHVRQSMTWNSNVALKRTLTEYLDNEKFLRPMSTSFRFGEEEWRKQPGITRREQLYRLLAILEGHQGKGMELPVPPLGSHIAGMLEFEAKTSRNPDSQGYFKLGMFPPYPVDIKFNAFLIPYRRQTDKLDARPMAK